MGEDREVRIDSMGEYSRIELGWRGDVICRDRYQCGFDRYGEDRGLKGMIAYSVDMDIEINGEKRRMTKGEILTTNNLYSFISSDKPSEGQGVLSTKDGQKIGGEIKIIGPVKPGNINPPSKLSK